MKFYLISDNRDTCLGMRLAGIEGVVVHESSQVIQALDQAIRDPEIGIVLMTQKLMQLCPKLISDRKLGSRRPLIVGIPDRHGGSGIAQQLQQYVGEAVGIKL